MSPPRSLLVAVLLLTLPLLVASALPLPYGAQITQIEDADELRIRVVVYTLEYAHDPPSHYQVIRDTTAPEMASATAFTVWLPFPPGGGSFEGTYLDPQVLGLSAGLYQVIARWSDGHEEILDAEWFSLVEHPYVLRGVLTSETTVDVCTGGDLLECAEVELTNPDWWQDIGPNVLLDIYGWPIRLDGRNDCKIRVTWVEPMPAGAECSDPMGTEDSSWSTVRALYD